MRVTFDSGVLDYACRPERFPKDPLANDLPKIKTNLADGRLEGFYSESMLTLEGIAKLDRANVYSNTKINISEEVSVENKSELPENLQEHISSEVYTKITSTFTVMQPERQPLHREIVARAAAAKALGVRVLKNTPRIGSFGYNDPQKEFFLEIGEGEALSKWQNTAFKVSREIEARGVGIAQVKALGSGLVSGQRENWSDALSNARDIHEERAIQRAFAEWADAEAIASHIAYGIDCFCSRDFGKSSGSRSIFDRENRDWLTQTYGVKFVSLEDLLAVLQN